MSETRANLVAEIGSGSPILAMSGHMDVVDAGHHEKWTYLPFKLTEQDGKLYGRGTTDMKGALMGMVIALIELKLSEIYLKEQFVYLRQLEKKRTRRCQTIC